MRTVVRYENGRAIWSENVPAEPGPSRVGGTLGAPIVTASSGDRSRNDPATAARLRAAKASKYASEEERNAVKLAQNRASYARRKAAA